MRWLKGIGAVYFGIYLILPGCLCQVLAGFGIDVHGPRPSKDLAVGAIPKPSLLCCCDHTETKVAETTVNGDGIPAALPSLFAVWHATELPRPFPVGTGPDQPRGPPGLRSPWSWGAFSGVYRI